MTSVFLVSCSELPNEPVPIVHVTGTAVSEKGIPVPGVRFVFFPKMLSLASWQGVADEETDSTGSFRLDLIAGAYRVDVATGNHESQRESFETVISADNSSVHWVVHGVQVDGTVFDPEGAPLDGGSVQTELGSEGPIVGGHFYVFAPRGDRTFLVYPTLESGMPHEHFGPFSIAADTTLVLQLHGVKVSGIVTGPGGAPLDSTAIVTGGNDLYMNVATDVSGHYQMYLPSGTYYFTAYPRETWILPRLIGPASIATATTVDMDLSGVEWTGHVVAEGSTTPVEGATVRAKLVADYYERRATSKTDAGGQFRLVLEPSRQYELIVQGHDGTPLLTLARVASSDTTFALEVPLP